MHHNWGFKDDFLFDDFPPFSSISLWIPDVNHGPLFVHPLRTAYRPQLQQVFFVKNLETCILLFALDGKILSRKWPKSSVSDIFLNAKARPINEGIKIKSSG